MLHAATDEDDSSEWWRRGTIYEVYVRSFQDANDDGIGDLAGITSRLEYLAWLGVDALWITPFYPSPMADFGYDVTDYSTSILCSAVSQPSTGW
jgi:alpha-glucosidase